MNILHELLAQLPFAWAQYGFMQNALVGIILVSPLFAVLGCMVINNQMAFFSDAIGHSALTGIAVGVLVGMADPVWAMLLFAIVLAFGVTYLRHTSLSSTDTIIGLVMAFAVALGLVILSREGGFGRKYAKYLVGDILSISSAELAGALVMLALIFILWLYFFNRFLLALTNRSLARSRGVNVWLVDAIFATVVAVVVTVSLRWVGLLVVNSLLILPAAAARNVARGTAHYMATAIVVSTASGVLGLIASYYLRTTAGATIVLFCMAFFLASIPLRRR